MSSDWAKAKACDHLFGDNFPSGAEVHVERLAALLDHVRDTALQDAADAFDLFDWKCLDHGGEEIARIRDIIHDVRERK